MFRKESTTPASSDPQPERFTALFPGDTASDHRNSGGGGTETWVLARWDTPRVVKGVSFRCAWNVAAEDGSDRLVSSAGTPDTQYRFRG
ncbi:hypothetical protein KCP76_24665 [Salmonella enterica subsp. enterica serovar Weltevreden]|nr:hypothetical protein KCP76_24665 [Salmonella enterica subsp. enterica serovar Weltevreden]